MELTTPILVIAIALAIVLGVASFIRNYIRVAPNEAAILYGRKRSVSYTVMVDDGQGGLRAETKIKKVGFRIVKGGSAFKLPVLEKVTYMPLNVMTLNIVVTEVYSKDGVPVTIEAIANVKVKGDEISIEAAAERFLRDKPELLQSEMRKTIEETLQGHLRAIIGKMTPEELYSDRDKFSQNVQQAAGTELEAMGITIDNLPIKEVKDSHGYLDALGRGKIAEVVKNAEIAEANAKRDSAMSTSGAQKEAEQIMAQNAVQIAEAQKERDIKKATYAAAVAREQAMAEKAHEIATAAQDQQLKVAQAQRDAAEKTARIKVEEEESKRMEQELNATVVKKAEAEKKRIEIEASAAKQKLITEAEAEAEALKKKADAEKEYKTKIGEGDAAKEKAVLVAQAEGKAAEVREKLLAEAAGKSADAEATEKLAEALKKLDQRGQLILILNKAPELIREAGDAGDKIMTAIFKNAAAPLGNIDSLHILDMGGKGNGIDQMSAMVPNLVTKVFAAMKTLGWDPSKLLEKLGIEDVNVAGILGPLVSSSEHAEGAGRKTTRVDA